MLWSYYEKGVHGPGRREVVVGRGGGGREVDTRLTVHSSLRPSTVWYANSTDFRVRWTRIIAQTCLIYLRSSSSLINVRSLLRVTAVVICLDIISTVTQRDWPRPSSMSGSRRLRVLSRHRCHAQDPRQDRQQRLASPSLFAYFSPLFDVFHS